MPRGIAVHLAKGPSLEFLVNLWHKTWYARFPEAAHREYRRRMFTSMWARGHSRPFVLVQNGKPRSGLIVHRLSIWLRGVRLRVAGIACVATDPAFRGRGLAALLMSRIHRRLADERFDAALLYSDIGFPYYERMGYVPWPLTRTTVNTGCCRSSRRTTVEPEVPGRQLQQSKVYNACKDIRGFCMDRTRIYWRHILARARLRARLFPTVDARTDAPLPDRWLACREGKPAAYARLVLDGKELLVTDAAHRTDAQDALRDLLIERARAMRVARVTLVAPRALLDRLHLPIVATKPVEKMMLRPLGGRAPVAPDVAPTGDAPWMDDWF